MLQQILKEATRENHLALEEMMFAPAIKNETFTVQQYTQVLHTNFIVNSMFEDHFFSALSPDIAVLLDINLRRKRDFLLRDLVELNEIVTHKEKPRELSCPKNDSYILGAMYVLEGATLGGKTIVTKLKDNKNLIPLNLHYHYYHVYGDNLGLRWQQFCKVLNAQPSGDYHISIAGAKEMFQHIADTHVNRFNRGIPI